MIDWAYKFWARKRESLNFAQPQIVPNFTRTGFKITKLPDDVFNPIRAFWDKRKAEDRFTSEGYGVWTVDILPILLSLCSLAHGSELCGGV